MYHHRIEYFPVMSDVNKGYGWGGGGGCMFLKKGGMKKERGADIAFCTML